VTGFKLHRSPPAAAAIVVTALVFLLTACGGEGEERGSGQTEDDQTQSLLLYCAAGIRPPVAEIAALFTRRTGVPVVVDYAGSEVLLSKIRLTRRGDLYMPGDRHYVDQAAAEGMILSRRSVSCFVPAILVGKGNPRGIRRLEDLFEPGVRLGLGNPEACAIGRQCRKIFEKNGFDRERVEKNLVFQSLTVNELGLQIQAGSLDATIVWDAIARPHAARGEVIAIPAERNIVSAIDVGVLSFANRAESARRFVGLLVSGEGKTIFRSHGYQVEPAGESDRP
jgi:molybdate transport system substrate-binding protein